ncbi:MAG TPA: hypothetical protein VGI39_14300, partial [Polyangiaceae bacterium]
MKRKLIATSLGAFAFSMLAASSASAVEPAESYPGWSVAGLIGFGFENYNAFGIGARFGYTLPSHVYLGGTFIDYPGLANYYGNSFSTGFEGGYEIEAGPLIVRPYGGIGLIDVAYTYGGYGVCYYPNGAPYACGGYTNSAAFFAFWAGGTALFPLGEGKHWIVGGDLRFMITALNYG